MRNKNITLEPQVLLAEETKQEKTSNTVETGVAVARDTKFKELSRPADAEGIELRATNAHGTTVERRGCESRCA